MKPTFIFAAITLMAMLLSAIAFAQEVAPDSRITDILPTIQTDSLKNTKKAKRKKQLSDSSVYIPYSANNNVVKPPSYNSYRENPKPTQRPLLPVGEIIRDIITTKK